MNNKILFGISIIALIATVLWAKGIIEEPTAAFFGTVVTSVGLYFAIREKKTENQPNSTNSSKPTSQNITQISLGDGDNIGRDKIIN